MSIQDQHFTFIGSLPCVILSSLLCFVLRVLPLPEVGLLPVGQCGTEAHHAQEVSGEACAHFAGRPRAAGHRGQISRPDLLRQGHGHLVHEWALQDLEENCYQGLHVGQI